VTHFLLIFWRFFFSLSPSGEQDYFGSPSPQLLDVVLPQPDHVFELNYASPQLNQPPFLSRFVTRQFPCLRFSLCDKKKPPIYCDLHHGRSRRRWILGLHGTIYLLRGSFSPRSVSGKSPPSQRFPLPPRFADICLKEPHLSLPLLRL